MRFVFFSFLSLFLWSCGGGGAAGWPEKDLIEYGIPMTIKAPEDVEVVKKSLGFQQDVVVKNEEDYNVQIFVSDAIVNSESAALQAHKELVEESPVFHQLVRSEDRGFIFENKVDSTHSSFGFRYVKLMGGKEYIFQEGLMGNFSQDAVEAMFESVKQD